jgi:hypothetical protein
MTHISSELLNDKNFSLWLCSIAILAFAAGYGVASISHSGTVQAMEGGSQTRYSDLAMGKYGHFGHRP